MLIVSTALAYWILYPADILIFGKDLASVVLFGSNIRFWRSITYFAPQAVASPLVHTWSLGIEEQFYITFPLACVWLFRRHRQTLHEIIVLALVSSFVLCVGYSEMRNPQSAFFLLPMRAWELLLGTAIALRSWRLAENARRRNIASLVAVGGIIASIVFFDGGIRFPGFAAALPALSTAVLLDANRGEKSVPSRLLSAGPIVALGLVSYSLYLWHWPLLAFAHYGGRQLNGWQIAALLAATGVCAALSWRFVERPVRKRKEGGLRYSTVISLCGAAVGVLALFTAVDQFTAGFRSRFAPKTLAVLDAANNFDREADDRCSSVKPSEVARGGLCRFGPATTRAPEFLVWGDSHASMLMPAFGTLAGEYGAAGLIATMGGCPPMLGTESKYADDISQCRQYNDSVFALLRSSGIHTVVLAAYWSLYTRGRDSNDMSRRTPFRSREQGRAMAEENKTRFERALANTISKLASLGLNTYLVADVPAYRGLISHLANSVRDGGDPTELGAATAVYRTQREELDSLFARFTDGEHVKILDPGDLLCSGKRCSLVSAGQILYVDDDHLSTYGALALKPIFAPLFSALP